MKELAEFTCNAWPILVFVGFVTGLFCTAVTLAGLSYANRKNFERQEKQFAKCFEFMEAYNEALQDKCNAVTAALEKSQKQVAEFGRK